MSVSAVESFGRVCSVGACGKPVRARGLCPGHYTRWQRYGDPCGAPEPRDSRPPRLCAVKGCTAKHRARGYCRIHYIEWYRRTARRCSIDGCDEPIRAHDLCNLHYHRRRVGAPLHGPSSRGGPRGSSFVESFWARVEKTDGCWWWRGKRDSNGYGLLRTRGPHRKDVRAHRVSWHLSRGPIPNGLCVCHRCDEPLCVRPDHLFLGTRRDNSQDMVRKGRARGNRRLPPEVVQQVEAAASAGLRHVEIETRYGVKPYTLRFILRRMRARNAA